MESGPARMMWPSHRNRLSLIFLIKSKLVVCDRASVGIDFPVIRANITLFAPLILYIVTVSRSHVSQPYVSREQTAASYNRNLTFSEICGESKMWRSLPHLDIAIATLASTALFRAMYDTAYYTLKIGPTEFV